MESLKDQWAGKASIGTTQEETMQYNAAALGEYTAYERLKNLEFDQF